MNTDQQPPILPVYIRRDITTPQQGKLMLTAYQDDKLLCRALSLGLLNGLHRNEFLNIRYGDIDPVAKTIDLTSIVTVKPRATRFITLTETTAAWLALFTPGAPGDRIVPLNAQQYNGRLGKVMRDAGLGPYSNDFLRRAFLAHLALLRPPVRGQLAVFHHTHQANRVKAHFYRAGENIFGDLTPSALGISTPATKS